MADRVVSTSQTENCSISAIFESALMLALSLQLRYLLVCLWFLLRGGMYWMGQSGFTMSFCVLTVYTARICWSFCFLSTDSCLLVSLPEDLLENKIWEAQFFCCVSSSHVLIVREGKPSLIPGLDSVFARAEALDCGLQNHITGPCPSSPSRRQEGNGAKVGNLPFSQEFKLHKTPSVKALIKQLLLASLCNKQRCLLRLTAVHGALSDC